MTPPDPSFLLPALLATPLLGAILVMLLGKDESGLARGVGLTFSLIALGLSLAILVPFSPEIASPQLVFDKEWIPVLGTHFRLGIDGISIWLVILTTFLTPVVLLSAHGAITQKVREFVAVMLILEAGMLGAFLALDVFLFYIFWEVMLIPMYLLIGIWGGKRRVYASVKFVLYTMVGSLLMLVAIFYVYAKYGAITGEYTTDLGKLTSLVLPHSAQVFCFGAFALAFAIKVPLFPLHTWLPDAHVEAPTAGSVVLAGVLLKFGIYGFIRFAMPMFPHGAAAWAPYMAILGVAGIVYGAFMAFVQDDVKKLIAYSSVSHLGFCMLGLFSLTSAGIEGSIFAMLSHGLTTSGLFLAIGVLYERRHTRKMADFGGLMKPMPVFGAFFLICVLGSAGLPGLSGFVGEFLTIFGTFIAGGHFTGGGSTFPAAYPDFIPMPGILAAVAATGVILGAIYLLYMFQKVMFGPVTVEKNKTLPDLSRREVFVFIPIIAMIFVMGLFPRMFLKSTEKSVEAFISDYKVKLTEPDGPARVRGFVPLDERPAVPTDEDGAGADPAPANGGGEPAPDPGAPTARPDGAAKPANIVRPADAAALDARKRGLEEARKKAAEEAGGAR